MSNDLNPLYKAIQLAGGQTELAKLVGRNQGHVSSWLRRGGRVPANLVLLLSKELNNLVTPFEFRPDVFGHSFDDWPRFFADEKKALERIK